MELSQDYKYGTSFSKILIQVIMIGLMLEHVSII